MSVIYTRQAVLTVGNALNGSSFRGVALGFKLEALLKVFQEIVLFFGITNTTAIVTRNEVR